MSSGRNLFVQRRLPQNLMRVVRSVRHSVAAGDVRVHARLVLCISAKTSNIQQSNMCEVKLMLER